VAGIACPTNWKLLNNYCYLTVDINKNFADAKSYCEGLGARLPIISDKVCSYIEINPNNESRFQN